jgi:dihydrofolate synthase/folylpolyglutamate synthase
LAEPTGAFARLAGLRGQSVELGLAQITHLLDRLDHPERDYPAVHVAGTNGKGSVCAMIAASLEAAGHRVGLLTSPHLVDYAERIRVDGLTIRDADATSILEELANPDGGFDGSFFEVVTALALEHFRRRGVDVAVLEVGLGGRLDATNVCIPKVAAITSIDLDHVQTLGPDRPSIAAEKAGIVKPGIPVVVGPLDDGARGVIEAIAARRGAPFRAAPEEVDVRVLASGWDGLDVSIRLPGDRARGARVPLPGRHQVANLQVAALASRLFDPRPDALELLLAGLEHTRWPGRLQRVEGNPVRVYDVAHNAAGSAALADALDELGVPEGSVAVIGVLADKDLEAMAAAFARHFRRAVATTPPHPARARPAAETAAALEAAGIDAVAVDAVGGAVDQARSLLGTGGWLFVTGSLFTVGPAMEALGDPVDGPANLAARGG